MSSVELVDNNYELVLEQGEGLSEKKWTLWRSTMTRTKVWRIS
jgi:hypothetical protein